MREERVPLGNEAIEPSLEISTSGRIGILLNDEAGGGVAQKERTEPFVDTAVLNDCGHLVRDLVQARARCRDLEFLEHDWRDLLLVWVDSVTY